MTPNQCAPANRYHAALPGERDEGEGPGSVISDISHWLTGREMHRPRHPTLIGNNRWLHGLLTDGVEVEYRNATAGENRGGQSIRRLNPAIP
jgi:hypothetical protein